MSKSETIPLTTFHRALKSVESRIDGAKHADSVNERNWHLDLALKMIKEELWMNPMSDTLESETK